LVSQIPASQTAAAPPPGNPERHEFVLANFRTENGVTLPQARIVYGTYGHLNACAYRKSNVGPPARTGCKSKCSGCASPGAMDEHEKSTLRFGEQGESRLVGQRESAHLFLYRNCGEDCQVQAARRSSALCNFGVLPISCWRCLNLSGCDCESAAGGAMRSEASLRDW
jgi:hypothetical protein